MIFRYVIKVCLYIFKRSQRFIIKYHKINYIMCGICFSSPIRIGRHRQEDRWNSNYGFIIIVLGFIVQYINTAYLYAFKIFKIKVQN